ncbi:MAG: ATP-binding cassette domain-containing protein [Pseudomonadota bacterium]
MAHIKLQNVNVSIPVYDSNALRLFRLRGRKNLGKVGSHNFDSSGILKVNALIDLSLDIEHGDRVALIGHNGAGKTTLLRYLAGIYPEVSGKKDIEGSLYIYGGTASLNPDATGYENVKIAMQLGNIPLSKFEECKKDVAEFTELGEYLEMPTRIYSAGMTARLSFAIATMHAPEILLIDEGIGAGDAKFANKAEERVKFFTEKASIIIFASHSNDLLRKMCNKGIVFEGGKAIYQGAIEDALLHYEKIVWQSQNIPITFQKF